MLPAVERRHVASAAAAEEAFPQLMVDMVRSGCLAVDCEWSDRSVGACVLQLATRGLVVIVDLCALPADDLSIGKRLDDVVDLAFASRHVMLLGFDAERNDAAALRTAWARRGRVFPPVITRYVDVRRACGRAAGGAPEDLRA